MLDLLAQLSPLAPGEMERWLMSAAAVGSTVLIWLRLTGKRLNGSTDHVTREEFRQHRSSVQSELSTLRDRIDSRHLAVMDKLDHLQSSLHDRLSGIEAGLARLDERTKKP